MPGKKAPHPPKKTQHLSTIHAAASLDSPAGFHGSIFFSAARVAGGDLDMEKLEMSHAGRGEESRAPGRCLVGQRARGTDWGRWAGPPAVRRAPAKLLRSLAHPNRRW